MTPQHDHDNNDHQTWTNRDCCGISALECPGLAEMSGPFDPEREVDIWTEGFQGNEGVIPTRWIVAKGVAFSVIDDLSYNDKRVTQLRHANT